MTGTISLRVYYEDTDCGGVVYYANYLRYMERGRTELLRSLGVNLADLHGHGIFFVVTEAHLSYKSSARYDDLLLVESAITATSAATLTIDSSILRASDRTLLVSGIVVIACIDSRGKAIRIPPDVRKNLPPRTRQGRTAVRP